ncbi:hypothetical protein ACFV4N_19075 [Actinosynnema sp. NPDC059797]
MVPAIIDALGRALDTDGCGAIGHEEFRTAIGEFSLGTDPDAPGNWLLGSPLGGR